MSDGKKQVQITPETALGFVDGVLEKYEGTRTDHQILQASMGLLKQIVGEWKDLKARQNGASREKSEDKPVAEA